MGERFRLKASFDISRSGRRAGHPARDEEIRNHAGRQRLGLVHLRQAGLALEQRQPAARSASCSGSTSKPSMPPCCTSIRTRARQPRRRDRGGEPVVRRRPSGPIEDLHGDGDWRAQQVTWSVNNLPAETRPSARLMRGPYLAPPAVPNPATVTVRAASISSPTSTARGVTIFRCRHYSVIPCRCRRAFHSHRKRRRLHHRVGGLV